MFATQNKRLDGSLLSGTPLGKHCPGYFFHVPFSFSTQDCRCACASRQHDGGKLPTTGFNTHSSKHAKMKRMLSRIFDLPILKHICFRFFHMNFKVLCPCCHLQPAQFDAAAIASVIISSAQMDTFLPIRLYSG